MVENSRFVLLVSTLIPKTCFSCNRIRHQKIGPKKVYQTEIIKIDDYISYN